MNYSPHLTRCRPWQSLLLPTALLYFARVVNSAKCIVVTHICVRLSVCMSAAACTHYCTDPDVTWRRGRGCPLVVHCWADLQSGHGLRCYGNITRTLVTSLRPSRDMTTQCERPAGWGLHALLAGDWPSMGGVLKHYLLRRSGPAAWTAGFHGGILATQTLASTCLYSLYA